MGRDHNRARRDGSDEREGSDKNRRVSSGDMRVNKYRDTDYDSQDRRDRGRERKLKDCEKKPLHLSKDLAGVKVLHGLDKVMEGGAVVLTLKDRNILADGHINDEPDMLENVEIGEQKRRDHAYKAAKKKTGTYFDEVDDPVENVGVTLDASGRFTGEAEKKLQLLHKRKHDLLTKIGFDDLTSSSKISSDYYTQDEMLQFKKLKKKKSLRKKDKLDLDALEAEARRLGAGDLGSRKDGKRQSAKEEQQRAEAQMRSEAYHSAYAKAEVASKALRQELPITTRMEEDENLIFGDEDEDFYKSLEKSRRLSLKKQEGATTSGPQRVALLALVNNDQSAETQTPSGEPQENKVVFAQMVNFVSGHQLNEETDKPEGEDSYKDQVEVLKPSEQETKAEPKGRKETIPAETFREVAIGKGLSGALILLKERGALKETTDWGGRNMDKKRSKIVGFYENDRPKEILIERLDKFGQVMTPKEAFREICYKFHAKEPGKRKRGMRMKKYQKELKLKQQLTTF